MNINDELKTVLKSNFAQSYFSCCILSNFLCRDNKEIYISELKEKQYIMKYTDLPLYKMITILSKIFGLNFVIKLLDWRRIIKYGR
jgi:hypothetical protein